MNRQEEHKERMMVHKCFFVVLITISIIGLMVMFDSITTKRTKIQNMQSPPMCEEHTMECYMTKDKEIIKYCTKCDYYKTFIFPKGRILAEEVE